MWVDVVKNAKRHRVCLLPTGAAAETINLSAWMDKKSPSISQWPHLIEQLDRGLCCADECKDKSGGVEGKRVFRES